MVPEQRFFISPKCSAKFEKKNPKIAENPKINGKVETSKINRERRNTITVTRAADVTTNITHINHQQTNPSNEKKMAYTTKI